jgi:beta-lactam-binding protein with PASTA domain
VTDMLLTNGAPPVGGTEAPTQPMTPVEPRLTLAVRAPEDDPARDVEARVTVSPGGHATLIAHVRNESEIVDSYELTVMFRHSSDPKAEPKPLWYAVAPQRIYLMPIEDGSFELDAQIEFHPPRTPEAKAGAWELTITARSRAHGTEVTARATLIIEPYADVDYVVSPHMARGRLGAPFVAAIGNRSNATADVELLLVGEEEGLRFEAGTRRLTWRALGLALAPFIARGQKDAAKSATKQLKPPAGSKDAVPKEATKAVSKDVSQASKAANARIGAAGKAATSGGPELPQPVTRTLPAGGHPDTVPFVVRPERQIWIGRSAYRRFTVSARVAGDDAPVVPRYAVFRQRPWLPWWIAILIPLIAIGVALYLALKPKMVVVPNLVGAKSTFAAQEKLQQHGLMLNPNVQMQISSKPAGSVIGQTPAYKTSVKKGSQVAILVAAGSGLATVPQLKGKTVTEAAQIVTKAGLTLGMVLPTPKPNGIIGSQAPAAGLKRKNGTPVDVFLASPKPKPVPVGTTTGNKHGQKPTGGAPGTGGGAAATIAVPKPAGATLTKYEAALKKAGLTAGAATWEIDTAPRTTVIATDPTAGTKVKAGTAVKTTVSAGFPDLAFDDGGGIVVLHGYTGTPVARLGEASDTSPTWSPDGKTIVDTTGPILLATDIKHLKKPPAQLTAAAPGVTWTNPTFAPTTTKHVLAVIRHDSGPDALCFLLVSVPPKGSPGCLAVPGWKLSEIAWSPDGRSVLVSASSLTTSGTFGLLRFVATVPFAASPAHWSTNGTLATPTAAGQGVLTAQISPNGASMAVVSSVGTGSFRVGLTKPKDLSLKKLKLLPMRGCDVAWRSDSEELAVVQSDPACSSPMGSIVGLDPSKPRNLRMIAFTGEHPSWQPVRLGP